MKIEDINMVVQQMLVIEAAMLRLRKELCVGSMLRGWELKQTSEISETQVWIELNEAAVAASMGRAIVSTSST